MDNVKVSRGERVVDGPLGDLELNKYKTKENLYYPLSLRGDNSNKHYIKFSINIPERSKYTSSGGSPVGGGFSSSGGAGVTQEARNSAVAEGLQVIGSNSDPIDAGAAALAAGADFALSLFGAKFSDLDSVAKAVGAGIKASARGAIIGGILAFVDMTRKTRRLEQQIYLYVPDTVQQTVQNKWSAVSLTDALGVAGLIGQGGEAVASSISEFFKKTAAGQQVPLSSGKTASSTDAAMSEALGRAAEASGAFGGDIQKVALASAGYAQNPQIEILFDTVDNRRFQFDFKFTPKSQQEAVEVLNIIKAFRFHAAPELVGGVGGGRYFVPPSEFDISYQFGDARNGALHKFGTCVLEGIDVNYSNGNFATYDDGMPVEIGMTLKFLEIEILHKKLIAEGY